MPLRHVCLPAIGALAIFLSACTRADSADGPRKSVRIVLIGDSTVCDYPDKQVLRGWGQFIQEYFKDTVSVRNHAAGGRSSKTFILEGRWTKALEEKPDFVLIQFGHNDSHAPGQGESTDAATDYPQYLRRYIADARAGKATPILVTPVCRRLFGQDGKLIDALRPYADAMKQVAAEEQVPLIDLHAASVAMIEPLGEWGSQLYANEPKDRTHFNKKGAKAMAKLVMNELPNAAPALRAHLR